MNDDELIDRVKRTLRAEAAGVHSAADAWERHVAAGGGAAVRPRPFAARRAPAFIGAGALGLAAAVVVLALVLRPGHHATSLRSAAPGVSARAGAATGASAGGTSSGSGAAVGAPSAGPVAPSAGAAAPLAGGASGAAASTAAGGPVPAGFSAASVTFVSADQGWVLGSAPCSSAPCTSILRTTDGGQTWQGIPAPRAALNPPGGAGGPAGVSSLRFADDLDGWAWGPDLWSTHDGGTTWRQVSVAGSGSGATIMDLEASHGLVHAAVLQADGRVRLITSPVGSDDWQASPLVLSAGAGPVPTEQLVLHGNAGWLLQDDRTVVGGARLVGGSWAKWTPPCSTSEGPAVLAASSSTDLVALCDVGLWSTPQGEHLYASSDGGATFVESPVALPASQGVQAVAAPSPATVVAGATVGGARQLLATFNGGATWSAVLNAGSGDGWADVGFTTPSQGVAVAVAGGSGAGTLYMTHDGGHRWGPVTF